MLNIFATCLLCLDPLQILANRGLGTGIFFLGCSISLASSHWLIMFHQFWCIVALSSWSHWNSYKTRWCISFWVVQRLESLKSSDLSWNFPVLSAESRKLFATVSCMIYHGYTQLRKALITLTIHNVPAKSYLGKLHKLLSDLSVLDPCLAFISGPCYPSWNPHGVIVDIEKLDNPILSPSFRPAGWFFNHCLHIPAPTLSICFGMDLSMAARLCGLFTRLYHPLWVHWHRDLQEASWSSVFHKGRNLCHTISFPYHCSSQENCTCLSMVNVPCMHFCLPPPLIVI